MLKLSFFKHIYLSYVAMLLLLATIFGLSYYQARALIDQVEKVERTYQVLDSLEIVLAEMLDIESGTRGYLLMGNLTYLQPYESSRRKVQREIKALEQLLDQEHFHYSGRLQLQTLTEQRIAFSEKLIQLRQSQGLQAALQVKNRGEGLKLMQAIRAEIDMIKNQEKFHLSSLMARQQSDAGLTLWVILFSGSLAVLLIALSLGRIHRHFRARQQAESNLKSSLDQAQGLAAFSQAVNQHLDPQKCFQTLIETYSDLINRAHASILLYDKHLQAFKLIADSDARHHQAQLIYPDSQSFMLEAMASGHLIHVDQYSRSEYAHALAQSELPEGLPDNAICIPLMVGTESIGVMNFYHFESALITEQSLNNLNQIAACFALALRNAVLYEQVQDISFRDELTQCQNRRFLYQQIHQEMQRFQRYGQAFSLILLDLDHFKQINDLYGHQGGDKILCQFAELVRGMVRQIDVFCRIGGEEFVILLPNTQQSEALILADRIQRLFAASYLNLGSVSVKIGVSMGLAEWSSGETADSLLSRADKALYQAKSEGRQCWRLAQPLETLESIVSG